MHQFVYFWKEKVGYCIFMYEFIGWALLTPQNQHQEGIPIIIVVLDTLQVDRFCFLKSRGFLWSPEELTLSPYET